MKNKFIKLHKYLSELNEQGICLAFSGGIDSTVLLYLCKDLNTTAVTFKSVFQTDKEIDDTKDLCKFYGVPQKIIEYYPLENQIIKNNPKDRCYHCKKLFFSQLKDFAGEKFVIDGTNADDLKSYRPGIKALKELKILSPLAEFGITKDEIREFAKISGIKIYDKPSTPCFATRFPYGTELNEILLNTAKNGEEIIKSYGFNNCRFRIHKNTARIEIPLKDIEEFLKYRTDIIQNLKKETNLKYFTLDLEGLRSGSMDKLP